MAFVDDLKNKAKELGLRIGVDNGNESVGKKIRSAEMMKIPYVIVIGEKEVSGGEITPRIRADLATETEARGYVAQDLLEKITAEAQGRVPKSTL